MRIIYGRRYVFLISSALFAILVFQGAQKGISKKYTGMAKLERRSDITVDNESSRGAESFATLKRTLVQELIGPGALSDLIDHLKLTAGLPRENGILTSKGQREKHRIIEKIRAGLSVKFAVQSETVDIVVITYTGTNQQQVPDVPNFLVKRYIDSSQEAVKKRLKASQDYLTKRLGDTSKELARLESLKTEFEAENVGMTGDSPAYLAEQKQKAMMFLEIEEAKLTDAQKKLAQLEAIQEGGDSTEKIYGPNPAVQRLSTDLRVYQDELERSISLRHMTEKHPTVIALRASIAMVKRQLQKTKPQILLQTVYSTAEGLESLLSQLAAAQADVEALAKRVEYRKITVNELKRLLGQYPGVHKRYVVIETEYKEIKDLTDTYRRKLRDVTDKMHAEAEDRRTLLTQVRMAEMQYIPSSPKLKMLFAFAIIGGLGVGGGLAFLLSIMDPKISDIDPLSQEFDMPVFGTISELTTVGVRAKRKLRKIILIPTISVVLFVVLVISAITTYWWLLIPDEYAMWQDAPIGYLFEKLL